MSKYKATIGLEIHAELNTKSKMFCGCDNASPPGTEPNINTCEVCTGHPGVLPVMNKEAVEATIKVGLALGMKMPKLTKWDRKQYFYPDLPKGYQISQYDLPATSQGKLKLSNGKTIRITRVHLEEDTGKLTHKDSATSLVDFNRAGTPLLELVTEPDVETSAEAKEFAKKYQSILRALGISNADMEKGEMRVEANVSIRPVSSPRKRGSDPRVKLEDDGVLGTKVEVKNINSFKAVERAIDYEIKRQTEVLDEGGEVAQETRGWNDAKQKTFSQRIKETAADYRYFPEPDLTEIEINERQKKSLKESLSELPEEKKERYIKKLSIPESSAEILANDMALSDFYEKLVMHGADGHLAGLFVTNELTGLLNTYKKELKDLESEFIADVLKERGEGKITSVLAKKTIEDYVQTGKKEKADIVEAVDLTAAVKKAVAANAGAIDDYKKGKANALQFLVGQVMRETKGAADPKQIAELIKKEIKKAAG